MNLASLMVFDIYFYFREQAREKPGKAIDLVLAYDCEHSELAEDVKRMLNAWPRRVRLREVDSTMLLREGYERVENGLTPIAVVEEDESRVRDIRSAVRNPVIAPVIPALDAEEFGFFQEYESHDYELGGLNEWNGSPTAYSPAVLQSFSRVHCRQNYPNYVEPELEALRDISGTARLRALDIGCGPISRLRWGALAGRLEIAGVDPLNDLYDAILARHGLDALPEIRPSRRFNALAEEVQFGDEKFPFVYTNNALDHTRDLLRSMRTIVDVLAPNGIALFLCHTKEGIRQSYSGLHKYNIWYEDEILRYSAADTTPRDLLQDVGGLETARVVWADEESLCLVLRHAAGGQSCPPNPAIL
jgi:SAM-dependent methyltransferase